MSEHELWNELGNLYYLSGSLNQAIYSYNRSIQLESRFGKPYSNLALAYVRQGKYPEAVKLYQTGIKLLVENKEKAISWYRLGDVYRCLKNYRDAILAYQQGDLLDPTLNQDTKELGEVLYGPSELTSAPELSQVIAAEDCQPIAISSASDSIDAAAPSLDLTGPLPNSAIESGSAGAEKISPTPEEPKTDLVSDSIDAAAPSLDLTGPLPNSAIEPGSAGAEKNSPTPEEPKTDLVSDSLILHQEAVEGILTVEDRSAPPIDDEFFSLLFEQEPFEEAEEEELGDWLFYFESDHPESTMIRTDSRRFSSEELAMNAPIRDPVSARQDAAEYPSMAAREGQLETLVCIDFQNVAVAEIKDVSSLALAIATNQDGHTPATEEVTAAVIVEQEPVGEMDEAVSTEVELEIEKIKHVLDADPDNAMAWQTLGDLLKSAKRYKDAIYAYQQSVSKDPKNIDYRHRLGLCYAIEGQVEEAIRTFQEVLRLNPSHGLTHATLSGYYRKMGLEELAKKHITIAMKNIYDSENEYNRACLQALSGNLEEALSLLKVALETKQTFVDWVLRDPDLDGIRYDPRFKLLVSEFA